MLEYATIIWEYPLEKVKTGECAVCRSDLDKDFPRDFPDEWKFCCRCKIIAEMLVNGITIKTFLLYRDIARIIKKKITLVKK